MPSRRTRALGLLVLTLAATLLAAAGIPRLRVAADLEGSLYGHPAEANLQQFRAQFGNLETFFLFYRVEALDAAALGDLHDLVGRLARVHAVQRTVSLLDFLPARFDTREQLTAYLHEGRALERFRDGLAVYRLARGLAISRDGTHLGLLIAAAPGGLGEIESAAHETAAGARAQLLGYPVTERRVIELVRQSNRLFVPVAFLGGLLLMAVFLRHAGLVVLACVSVFAPLVWLLGTMGWCDERLNSFSTMLLPITLSTALTSTMYVFSGVLEVDPGDQDGLDRHLREHVRVPQLLCALSAAIGFVSMMFTPVPLLRRFGGWAAAGCAATLAAALVIPRAGIALYTGGRPAAVEEVGSAVGRLSAALASRPRHAFVFWTAATLLACVGLTRLHCESSASAALLPGDPITRATAEYARLFGAPTAVELVYRPRAMPAGSPGGVLAAQALQRAVEEDPLVDSTVSVADLHLDAGSRISGRRLPRLASEREAELYGDWLAGNAPGGDAGGGFVSGDGLTGRLLVRLRTDEAFAVRAFADRTLARIAPREELPRPLFVTGLQHASAVVHAEGVEGAVLALFGSLFGDLVVFGLIFRSLALAALCSVPNAFPLLLVYGAMGWLGTPLDVAAAVVGPVVYGMIMDDTFHLLHRLEAEIKAGMTPHAAVVHVAERLGRAVVVSSFTLAAGLGLSALAPFAMARSFGLAAAGTVLVALACELALTPLLVAQFPGVLRRHHGGLLYAAPRDETKP